MQSEKTSMSSPVHAVVMQLFNEQALTISKSGSAVSIQCEDSDDANAVFDWLADIGDDTEGDPIGWKIVATGNDGSVLCEAPNGRRSRYWFIGKSA
jgi:hypothetical protein